MIGGSRPAAAHPQGLRQTPRVVAAAGNGMYVCLDVSWVAVVRAARLVECIAALATVTVCLQRGSAL